MEKSITKYLTTILGLIFLAAGILKSINPENTSDIIAFFELATPSIATYIVYLIAILEMIFAISLFLRPANKVNHWIALFLTTSFLLIALLGYYFNWGLVCGCFGRFSFGRFDEGMLIRNSILVLMSIWICIDPTLKKIKRPKRQITNNIKEIIMKIKNIINNIVAFALLVTLISGFQVANSDGQTMSSLATQIGIEEAYAGPCGRRGCEGSDGFCTSYVIFEIGGLQMIRYCDGKFENDEKEIELI